jgi:hypothetical protein
MAALIDTRAEALAKPTRPGEQIDDRNFHPADYAGQER